MIKIVTKVLLTISYKIKFIDSARFMMSSLSNLVDNLAEGIHKTKCKGCASFLEHKCINDNLINYNCLFFNQKLLKQGWRRIKKRDSGIHLSFLEMMSTNLFYC